ncbi:hypothetical protein D3C72_2000370 [compost metagenome]
MIHDGVKAQFVFHEGALFRASGYAHGARAFDAGDLAHHRADRSAGCGDNDGFTGLGLADFEQAAICREARHAQHPKRGGRRRDGGV